MPPRSRYAVDPSLTAQVQQEPQYQQAHHQQPFIHSDSQARDNSPTYHDPSQNGPYAASGSVPRVTYTHLPEPQSLQPQPQPHPSYISPTNHIPEPPHSYGPQISGPRVRIDPGQMPNPIEAQELDQNLYDDEDFQSCQTRGVIPLAGTDWRGVDQGGSIFYLHWSRTRTRVAKRLSAI